MSFYNFAVCNGSRCIKDDVKYFPDMTEREFKKLYNLYFRPLCLYALHYVSDASVSEDIVQDKTHSIILIVNDNVRKSAPKSYTISGYVTDVVTGETLISAEIVSDSRSGAVEVPDKLLRTAPSVLGEPDVFKTLQMLPGIQAGTSFFSGIYVRGGNADENLVLLDGMQASAESIAPEPAEIVSVDTIPIIKTGGDRKMALTRIKVRVNDVPGIDNYYRIEAFVKYSISRVYLDPGEFDPVGPQFLRKGTISVKLDNKAEPILYSGSHVDAYYDPEDTDYYANEYNLFNDNAFRDKDMYTYYNDCMLDNSLQGMSDFIPLIPYPDNVNGGNGFVGALSVNDFEMELPYIDDVYKYYHNL